MPDGITIGDSEWAIDVCSLAKAGPDGVHSPTAKDPDAFSPTLRRYHKFLGVGLCRVAQFSLSMTALSREQRTSNIINRVPSASSWFDPEASEVHQE